MAQSCSVCLDPSRDDLDKALVARISVRDAAGRFGFSKSSVDRHKRSCLPKRLAKGRGEGQIRDASRPADEVVAIVELQRQNDIDSADALRSRVLNLIQQSDGIFAKAEASGDLRVALSAIRESRDCLTLLAKASGWLSDGGTNIDARSVNLFPNWKPDELRAFINALPAPKQGVTNT